MDGKGTRILLSVAAMISLGVSPRSGRADDASVKLYASKCAMCHGADGKGETPLGKANKIRDLASAEVQKQSDEDLTEVITKGKNKMPAQGKILKPDEIKGLVAYIRGLAKKS